MTRRRLYSAEYQRPSRRYGPPQPLRLSLHWCPERQSYVHEPTGSKLRGLIDVASHQGLVFAVEYPAAERCTFSVRS